MDRVCHTLVQTRQRFGICPTEMRLLSLTVAVIERAMFSYGRQVQEYKEKLRRRSTRITHSMRTPQYASAASVGTSHQPGTTPQFPYPVSAQSSAPLLPISTALEPSISSPFHYQGQKSYETNETMTSMDMQSDDSVETIGNATNPSLVMRNGVHGSPRRGVYSQRSNRRHRYKSMPLQTRYGQGTKRYQEEQLVWRHPGGVVSLLEILGGVLKATEEQLVALGNIASLTDFVQNVCYFYV